MQPGIDRDRLEFRRPPSNRQRDRIAKIRSVFVRERDRDDPVRLIVNVTGSIIADRGITAIHRTWKLPSGCNQNRQVWHSQKQYRLQDGQLYRVIYTNSKKGDVLSLYIKDAKTRIFNGSHIGPDTKAAWEDYF